MAETVQVELVTPEKALFSGGADMVEAPGVEGDFGVLPKHSPFVSLLRPGTVRIHNGSEIKEIFVTSGLAQVDTEKCVILAEQVHDMATMQLAEAEKLLKEANKHLARCQKDGIDTESAAKQVKACEVLVQTVSAA